MTTRVTIQISQAHGPVDVQVLTRQRDGSFAAPMHPTRIDHEGDACTFYVHANQRLQVIEADVATPATPVPPPLPSTSADSPDDVTEAAAAVDTDEDSSDA